MFVKTCTCLLLLMLTSVTFSIANDIKDYGHLVIILNPSSCYILCNSNTSQNKLSLININAADHQCIKSSQFNINSLNIQLDINSSLISSTNQTKNTIVLELLKHRLYRMKNGFGKYLSINIMNNIPILSYFRLSVVTDQSNILKILNFTFIPVENSPFLPKMLDMKYKNTEIISHWSLDVFNEISKNYKHMIGERVDIQNENGMKSGIIRWKRNTFMIDFDDGSLDILSNQSSINSILHTFEIGDKVDCYWPADRLKMSNLANVLWPSIIMNKTTADSKSRELFTVQFEDMSVYPNMPLIWIKKRMECKDNRYDCPFIALNNECRSNPSFSMIECRKSCKVCSSMTVDMPLNDRNNGEIEYYDIWMDEQLNYSTSYVQNVNYSSALESIALNRIALKLLLMGNISLAERYYKRSSFLGNSDAKFSLAHIYSLQSKRAMVNETNDKGLISKTILYLYFASSSGSLSAKLALGYRHTYGYGVPKSCSIAAKYYLSASETLFTHSIHDKHLEMISLNDITRRNLPVNENEDIIRFYHTRANNGDANAQLALGQLYLYGMRGFLQNFELAFDLFTKAAVQKNGDAYAFLGNMCADGHIDGRVDYTLAVEYYKLAIKYKSVIGSTGLGYLYLQGLGVDQNTTKAVLHFKEASKKGDSNAQFYLGLMYFNGIGVLLNYERAFEYFVHASRKGHAQSLYYTGYMHLNGIATAKSCKMGLDLLKMSAERTRIGNVVGKARAYYLDEEYDLSYYYYSMAAEQGFEIAQSNVGWLLKRNLISEDILKWYFSNIVNDSKIYSEYIAFSYFEWSAYQNNANSQRILGDYYFYLLDMNESVNYYQMAAENIDPDSQAMYNLGYMYMNGYGRQKDFQMAKRYFDSAMDVDVKANVVCFIALAYLYVQRFIEQYSLGHYWQFIGVEYQLVYGRCMVCVGYMTTVDMENVVLAVLVGLLTVVLYLKHRRTNNQR